MNIVIITTTFNRNNTISNLASSLINQTNQSFQWLIFDDNSSEDYDYSFINLFKHKDQVLLFKNEKNIGKAQTLNMAFDYCTKNYEDNTLLVVIDDDDILYKNAIDIIMSYKNKLTDNTIGALFFQYKLFTNSQELISSSKLEFIKNVKSGNFILSDRFVWANKYSTFDGVNAFFVKAIRNNRFSKYDNERYIGITTIMFKMSLEGFTTAYINETIGEAYYRDGGLTKLGKKFRLSNYKGMIEYSLFRADKRYNSIANQIKYNINMWAYAFEDENPRKLINSISKDFNLEVNQKLLNILKIPGLVVNKIWRLK